MSNTLVITVKQAECHDTCLDVRGPDDHMANVNPIGETTPVLWRVDCDSCFTCIQAGFHTKAEARDAAVAHVSKSSKEYWEEQDRYLEEKDRLWKDLVLEQDEVV